MAMEWLRVAAQAGFQISQANLAALLEGEYNSKPPSQRKSSAAAEIELWYKAAAKAGGEVGDAAQEALNRFKR